MIITICRTLNEERNVERFCEEYSKISDKILIADGGSEDRTVEMAKQFEKVEVRPFETVISRGDVWRNPHGEHINFMIDWAKEEGAEWIIYDDCDSLPNAHLKKSIGFAMKDDFNIISVVRLYLYKDQGYFHQMSNMGFAKWAWRSSLNVYADESDPWVHTMHFERTDKEGALHVPCCLLHFSWPDDEEIRRKAAFYKVAKDLDEGQEWHPTKFGGDLMPLPDWAVL